MERELFIRDADPEEAKRKNWKSVLLQMNIDKSCMNA